MLNMQLIKHFFENIGVGFRYKSTMFYLRPAFLQVLQKCFVFKLYLRSFQFYCLRLIATPVYAIEFSDVASELFIECFPDTGTLLVDGILCRISDIFYTSDYSLVVSPSGQRFIYPLAELKA